MSYSVTKASHVIHKQILKMLDNMEELGFVWFRYEGFFKSFFSD